MAEFKIVKISKKKEDTVTLERAKYEALLSTIEDQKAEIKRFMNDFMMMSNEKYNIHKLQNDLDRKDAIICDISTELKRAKESLNYYKKKSAINID